jgi:hypothetical protein
VNNIYQRIIFLRTKMTMKLETLEHISEAQFRRVTGVKRQTFNKMVEVVRAAYEKKRSKVKNGAGRPPKLSIEDRILMTLEYLREYRTYVNIGVAYGLSESNAYENIRWVEDVLIQSKEFRLPGKKALLKDDAEYSVVLIDATESPIERPQKKTAETFTIQAKRSVIR